jgi:glycosyltransferase involved in cell wall biosynthesis
MSRALLVTHGFPPQLGGVETVVAELARRLPAHGWEVEVVTEGPADAAEVTSEGAPVRRFRRRLAGARYPVSPGLWRYLLRVAGRYDVVHAHNFHALPSLAAAVAARGPLVFSPHYHGLGTSRLGRVMHVGYRPAGRYAFGRADRVICDSDAEAARVARDFPPAAGKVRVIPLGADLAGLRAAVPYERDAPVVLTAGRLHAHKRVERILGAFARIERPAELVVVGGGPAERELRRRAGALGARATFTGTVDRAELLRWLRTAAVYVSLSEQEAFGLGVAEAAGAGARVLASDIGAHREIAALAPDSVGLIGASAPVDEVARRLREAIDAPPPADAGRIPDWDDVARATAEVYARAIADRA